jgi:hypothetical protein
VETAKDRPTRLFRTGSPRDYFIGAALLCVAAWFAYEFLGAEHLRPIDRPAMAIIATATFGGLGITCLLRGGMRAVILTNDRVCVREWTGFSRCFPLDRLKHVVWSYRYAGGIWGHYDHGMAWLELEFADNGWRRVAVIDYAGRARHAQVEALTRELAARAGLSWDAGSDPLDATDLPAAEVIWERRRRSRPMRGAC